MKTLSHIKLAVAIIILVFAAASANAGEKVRVFELGETGITIEFPMTPGEIASEAATNGRFIAASPKNVDRVSNNVIVYEMGEGGHIVEFEATVEEIAAKEAEDARLADFRAKRFMAIPLPAGDRFEMAENGSYIVFPPAGVLKEAEDLAVALDKAARNTTGTD